MRTHHHTPFFIGALLIILLSSFNVAQPLSVQEIADKQYEVTMDMLSYFQQQMSDYEDMLNERIYWLEVKVADIESKLGDIMAATIDDTEYAPPRVDPGTEDSEGNNRPITTRRTTIRPATTQAHTEAQRPDTPEPVVETQKPMVPTNAPMTPSMRPIFTTPKATTGNATSIVVTNKATTPKATTEKAATTIVVTEKAMATTKKAMTPMVITEKTMTPMATSEKATPKATTEKAATQPMTSAEKARTTMVVTEKVTKPMAPATTEKAGTPMVTIKAKTPLGTTEKAATEKASPTRDTTKMATTLMPTTKLATTLMAPTKMATTLMPTTKMATTLMPTTKMATTLMPTTKMATTKLTTLKEETMPVSCADLFSRGWTTSGDYQIDPDGSGIIKPFIVFCEMEQEEGITVIGHNMEEENIPVDGFEKAGSFVLEPVYTNDVTMQQLGALADVSATCSQYAKYSCKQAALLAIERKSGSSYGWWVDRHGNKRVNWAGAPTDSQLCACGVTQNCFEDTPSCNCDHPKAKNQFDDGYFSDKDNLPVMSIRLGDSGGKKERAAITLGKFMCRG